MNKLIILILLILASISSYLIGAKAGFDKGWIYAQSLNTHLAASALTRQVDVKFNSIEDMKSFIDRTNRFAVKNGLIEYGRYISKFTSKLPLPVDVGDSTISFYRDSAQIYVNQLAINKIVVESSEDTANRVEQEMINEGVMDLDIWKTEKYKFLESLKEQESSLNSAIKSLIKD